MEKVIALAAAAVLLAACKAPTVNLSTEDPIKVDITMRLDVYQHGRDGTKKPESTTASDNPESARRNRMADIQEFKNSRLIGENREGLITIRVDPPGDYGDYVRKTVTSENADRIALMKTEAEREKISLDVVQTRQAELWRKRSFKDEWIEVPAADGTWSWQQKQ